MKKNRNDSSHLKTKLRKPCCDPLGSQEGDPNIMRDYYDGKTGRSHGAGHRQNRSMFDEREKLEEMRSQTGGN